MEPEVTDAEDRRAPQPRSLRVIGWLLLVLGVVSLPDEFNRILDGRGVRWVYILLGIVSVAGPAGLLMRKRWGYLVTLGNSLMGIVWIAWVFFIQGDYILEFRLLGIFVGLFAAIPVVFLPEETLGADHRRGSDLRSRCATQTQTEERNGQDRDDSRDGQEGVSRLHQADPANSLPR